MRYALFGYAVICAVMLGVVLWFTGGHLVYSLDDPYIHLALAENLPGNYCVNAPNPWCGAPSSSILYPYLLAPLAHTGLAFAAPLILNLIAGVLAIMALVRLERQVCFLPNASPVLRATCVVGFAAVINLFGLIFTGLEHVFQVACALVVLSGLIEMTEKKAPFKWFWVAVIAGPLFRYEMLAVSGVALLYAMFCGYWVRGLLVGLLTLVGPAAFSFYLHSLGYSWLPGSVLAKSASLMLASEGRFALWDKVQIVLQSTVFNFAVPSAWGHCLELLMLFGLGVRNQGRKRWLLLVVFVIGLAHLVVGQFGWFGRYEAYTLALNLLALLYAMPKLPLKNPNFVLVVLVIAAGSSGLSCTVQTAAAARDIHLMYGSLRTFLVDYWKDDVAAFDIGTIAWQNPHQVIDLMGLGSQRARALSHNPFATLAIPALLAKDGVQLIMSAGDLTKVFIATPTLREVAQLHVDGRYVVTLMTVRLYLIEPTRGAELREKLAAFRATLPSGVSLDILPP